MKRLLNLKLIKNQIYLSTFLFIFVPLMVLAVLTYTTLRSGIIDQIESRLKSQAVQTKLLVQNTYKEIQKLEADIKVQAKNIVKAQAEAVYRFTESFPGTDDQLKETIASIKVGQTGYIWVTDYEGNYVVSLKRQRDGENIFGAKDANGVFFIQEAIKKTKKLTGNGVDFQIYPWQNKGETVPRDKIAALVHDAKRKWVIGVSVYFDELVDRSAIENRMESLKDNISNIVVGKTGYIYILDSKGNYVVSYKRQRDGENIFNAKDSDGKLFIQEICNRGKKLKGDQSSVTYYPWQNKGESSSRMKLAAYSYFAPLDWIIAPSAYHADFLDVLDQVLLTYIIIIVLFLAIGFVTSFFFTRRMIRPIYMIKDHLAVLAGGNLNEKIEKIEKNEIGAISESYNSVVDSLREIITSVKRSALEVQESVREVSEGSNDIHTRTNEQAASITETSTTMEEFSAILKQTKESSEEVNDNLQQFNRDLLEKQELIDSVTRTMEEINDSSKKIDNIVAVINDISFQTNLLALNAAVEAARAGDAGRGFAVVASEVRNLAQKTAESSKSILDIVTGNLNATHRGTELVQQTSEFFNSVRAIVDSILASVGQISEGSKEQFTGIEQINTAVTQLENVLNQNASLSKDLAETSNGLLNNANELKEMVSKFDL